MRRLRRESKVGVIVLSHRADQEISDLALPSTRTAGPGARRGVTWGVARAPLALAEAATERFKKLAQNAKKAYNRLGHGSPPGQRHVGAYHYSWDGPCPLVCYW